MTMRDLAAALVIAIAVMITTGAAQAAHPSLTQNSAPVAGAPVLGLVDLGPETKSP